MVESILGFVFWSVFLGFGFLGLYLGRKWEIEDFKRKVNYLLDEYDKRKNK